MIFKQQRHAKVLFLKKDMYIRTPRQGHITIYPKFIILTYNVTVQVAHSITSTILNIYIGDMSLYSCVVIQQHIYFTNSQIHKFTCKLDYVRLLIRLRSNKNVKFKKDECIEWQVNYGYQKFHEFLTKLQRKQPETATATSIHDQNTIFNQISHIAKAHTHIFIFNI